MLADVPVCGEMSVFTVGSAKSAVKAAYSGSVVVANKNLVTVSLYAKPFLYAPVKKAMSSARLLLNIKKRRLLHCRLRLVKMLNI